jgi:hypothetical protein
MVNFGHFIEIKILCMSRTEFQEKKEKKTLSEYGEFDTFYSSKNPL